MQRHCDEDSGRSSCSAASIGLSPIFDHHIETKDFEHAIKRRYITKKQDASNTDLKVSARPRSCINLIKSPDERDPFPSCRIPRYHPQRSHVLSVFDSPRRGGLSNAKSSLDIASSTQIEEPRIQSNSKSLTTVTLTTVEKPLPVNSNFKRGKPVQRAASRLYKAETSKGQRISCVGPEFIVRASQPVKQLDLTLSAIAEKRVVTVVLLNGVKVEVLCDPNSITAGQLFEALVHSEKYEHNFMLGIAVLLGGDFVFLPDDYKIKKIAPENWHIKSNSKKKLIDDDVSFTVFLRIKFFLPTNIARNIQGGDWRYRVYLQLRRSTVEGQLTSTLQNLVLLAGYALHIEFGEFTYREHGSADYFLLEHYLPETLIAGNMLDVKLKMKRAHESRRGLERNTAIINYITLAQTFRDYGTHFYSAIWATRDGFCRDVWLSIGPKGITLYSRNSYITGELENNNNRIVLQSLPWHHIHTFYYNKKNLYIMPNSFSGMSKIGVKYKLKMSDNKSYFAFWLASLHHRLYLRLYAKEDFINYLSDELSCPLNKDGSPKKVDCSNYQDSYNLAVRNNPLRSRKLVKRRFKVELFSDKKAQNKENHKPNTEELLKQILIQQSEDSVLNPSPNSNMHGNSSNDGLSSSESCSLPRRHGVKMGTRVFSGMKSVIDSKYSSSQMCNSSSELRRLDDLATTQSDSDDLCSTTERKIRHCNINSMQLLPERQYNQSLDHGPTAFVIESPKVYQDVFNFNATSSESCLNASFCQKLDNMGCVQGERLFVTALLERDGNNALGLQVAEGSDGNVYIKSITPGGPAQLCNKLLPGDQIISVNGQTLLNVKYDKALSMLQTAPHKVELIVLQNNATANTGIKEETNDSEERNTHNLQKNIMQSVASGLDDLDIADDELLNEEALKTIYALIKLTKEKVISRMKDKENGNNIPNRTLQKCRSENKVCEDTDASNFTSQESTPRRTDDLKFNTWRGLPNTNCRPKRRPLSLSIPTDVHLPEDYLNNDLSRDLLTKTSLKSIQSSLNSLDSKSVKSVCSSRNVPLPRNFGLGRKWLGPVKYPVTPCKNSNLTLESAINDSVAKQFSYGAGVQMDDDQIFL